MTLIARRLSSRDPLHVDFNDGKRVMAWRRGQRDANTAVVVVANFSDFGTPDRKAPRSGV